MLEVFKEIIPMFLAAVFVYSAAAIVSIGIKEKGSLKVAIIGAIFIELISFTIWIPSLNGVFSFIGIVEPAKTIALCISILIIVLGTIIIARSMIKKTKT